MRTCVAARERFVDAGAGRRAVEDEGVVALRGDGCGAFRRARGAGDAPAFARAAGARRAARCSRARSRRSWLMARCRVPLGAHVAVALAREMAVAYALADIVARQSGASPIRPWRAPAASYRRAGLDARQQARVAGVAGGDQHVAHEAVASGALDRRAGKARAESGIVELQAIRRAAGCRFRRARESAPRARLRRTCSTGTRRGSRRSRRRGCPWGGGTRPGCGPCARSTGRRGSAAHRADRARGNAAVGQTSRQRRQLPQWSSSGASGGSSAVVKMAPRNSHEPCSRDTSMVFLPCQPRPAAAASGFSITGAVSTNTFTSAPARAARKRGELLQLALEDVVIVLAAGHRRRWRRGRVRRAHRADLSRGA